MSITLERSHVQSLVFSGHAGLPETLFVRLRVREAAAARRGLGLLAVSELAFGLPQHERTQSVQLLLSATGLIALQCEPAVLNQFEAAFREGIDTPQRNRALGDLEDNAPAKWNWRDRDTHAVLLIYGQERAQVEAHCARLLEQLADGWISIDPPFPISSPKDRREPFGFRDGITSARIDWGDGIKPKPGFDVFAPGEILLGERTAANTVQPTSVLGQGASLVVVRQLEQDVESFWKFWRGQAKSPDEAIWLVSKAIGRWPNGMPVKSGPISPAPTANESEILQSISFDQDRQGRGCPFGAHIRRANPRDGLEDDPQLSTEIVSHHRLLRRGRIYGATAPAEWYPPTLTPPTLDGHAPSTGEGRGLLFMALCADLSRQFEFVQQTWLNNPKFADLNDETDALAAGLGIPMDSRRFSIPNDPLRRRLHDLNRWVKVKAGGYFLLPGQVGLDYLAKL